MSWLIFVSCLCICFASLLPDSVIGNSHSGSAISNLIKSQSNADSSSLELPQYPLNQTNPYGPDDEQGNKNIQQIINRNNQLMRTAVKGASNVDNGKNNTIDGIRNFIKQGDANKIKGNENTINGTKNKIEGNQNNVNGNSNKIIDSSNNVVYGHDNIIQSLPISKSDLNANTYIKPNTQINSKGAQVEKAKDSSLTIESSLSNQFGSFYTIAYLLIALLLLQ